MFAPFPSMSPATRTAQYDMRQVKRFGMTRKQLAQIAIAGRAHAALSPHALVREALSMDQYMSARMAPTRLCPHDPDRFTYASTGLIVSAALATSLLLVRD
jgi:acetyl-CoA acetyltransferase